MEMLLINVGSSSLKAQRTSDGHEKHYRALHTHKDYAHAIRDLITTIGPFSYAVHRIVHGAGQTKTAYFTRRTRRHIEKGCSAAPLHNIPQLHVLDTLEAYRKTHKLRFRQICVFDSLPFAFSDELRDYPIPRKIASKHGIVRVGFHGLSHTYMRQQTTEHKIITVHLGSGCSVSGFVGKRAIYNSMGFTPLQGIIMATRSGTIDPGIILTLARHGYDAKTLDHMLNHESGWKAICGETEFLKILEKRHPGNRHDLAYRMFVRSVSSEIANALLAVRGARTIIFSGEIGAQSRHVRNDVLKESRIFGRFKHRAVHADEQAILKEEAEALIGQSR